MSNIDRRLQGIERALERDPGRCPECAHLPAYVSAVGGYDGSIPPDPRPGPCPRCGFQQLLIQVLYRHMGPADPDDLAATVREARRALEARESLDNS